MLNNGPTSTDSLHSRTLKSTRLSTSVDDCKCVYVKRDGQNDNKKDDELNTLTGGMKYAKLKHKTQACNS